MCASLDQAKHGVSRLFRLGHGKNAQVQLPDALELIARKQLVILGEVHGNSAVVDLQRQVQECMISNTDQRLNVIMEHFSFEMQHLLDQYSAGEIDLAQVVDDYHRIGTESHDISRYAAVLEYARAHSDQIKLHAGFIPRTYARKIMQGSIDEVLVEAKGKGYIAEDELCEGSDGHYSFFESLISRRDMHNPALRPSDQFRRMFPAQVLKDSSMAHKVNQLLACAGARQTREKYLVICGVGHMGYSFGVPERIFAVHPELRGDSCSIYSRPADAILGLETEDLAGRLADIFGTSGGAVAEPAAVSEETFVVANRGGGFGLVIREDGHVMGIRPGSAAEAAGVPCGRAEAVRIVRVNGRPVASKAEIVSALGSAAESATFTVRGAGVGRGAAEAPAASGRIAAQPGARVTLLLCADGRWHKGTVLDAPWPAGHQWQHWRRVKFDDGALRDVDTAAGPGSFRVLPGGAAVGAPAADLCFLFDEEREVLAHVKAETRDAYDKVGETAGRPGDLRLAGAVMARLGYSEAQIAHVGRDAYNYQGVGNPHRLAALQQGEQVACRDGL